MPVVLMFVHLCVLHAPLLSQLEILGPDLSQGPVALIGMNSGADPF